MKQVQIRRGSEAEKMIEFLTGLLNENRECSILIKISDDETSEEDMEQKQEIDLEEEITNRLREIGIPESIKGYGYLREAIMMTVDHYDLTSSVTKLIYPAIARKYNTTPSRTERAIRHAIEVAWNRGGLENVYRMYGYSGTSRPTNSELIALIADEFRAARRIPLNTALRQ